MPQPLDQILASLNPVYDPQVASNTQQQQAIDPQQNADLSGLNATKQSAFSDITNQANRNGMFYSGLPIAEEQKYVGGTYLPAVANLQAKYQQQRFSLQDALAKIKSDQYTQAYGIQADQQKQEEAAREFDRQLAAQTAAQAANRAAAAGSVPSFGNLGSVLGASTANSPAPASAGVNVPAGMQQLYNQVFVKPGGGMWSNQALVNDYNATYKSAQYGNTRDQQKLLLYHSVRPDLFGSAMPASAVGFKASY